ncbi:cadherin-like beta sandwich domain-containing protein [uncultured Paraglaciecola sp.]|uniref:cadherin-like beta sandwich domain-containing protein n=1 Tax=uncultured Paraglaciecola sp. TaxID=1765024 RepID=UPI00259A19F6|nr:cadherin-like beta sandwich domain-containing protein [uncultured Paraglaciecola sp.]
MPYVTGRFGTWMFLLCLMLQMSSCSDNSKNSEEDVSASKAMLSSLTLSSGTLSPSFSEDVYAYSVYVEEGVEQIQINPSTSNENLVVTINGKELSATDSIFTASVGYGINKVELVVSAQNGSTNTYSLLISREEVVLNDDTEMAILDISTGILSPVFSSSTTDYSVDVDFTVTEVNFTAITSDPSASSMLNGSSYVNGDTLPLVEGANQFEFVITAENATDTATYTIVVTRATQVIAPPVLNDDALLTSLDISTGMLNPLFNSTTTGYSVDVDYAVTEINFTAITSDPSANLELNGASYVNGDTLLLVEGVNQFEFVITAENATDTATYTVVVTRASQVIAPPVLNDDALLTSLDISTGMLNPLFNSTTINYSVDVDYAVTEINFTAITSDPSASSMLNGSSYVNGDTLPLVEGVNQFEFVITAENAIDMVTYTIVITRASQVIAPPVLNDDALLTSLDISTGMLNPLFNSTTINYSVDVDFTITEINFTAITSDPSANLELNGASYVNGDTLPLVEGVNQFEFVITAENATDTATYTVVVTRASEVIILNDDASLANLAISSGILSPEFNSLTTEYTASVESSVQDVTFQLITSDPAATIELNGVAFVNGQSQPLLEGDNLFEFVVTAENDSDMISYNLLVTRASLPIEASLLEEAFLQASNAERSDLFRSVAVYGDILVVGASGEDSEATGINGDQDSSFHSGSGAAYVFERSLVGNQAIWQQTAYLKASNTQSNDAFGFSVAIWENTIVVGAYGEKNINAGVEAEQDNFTNRNIGSAYVFIKENGEWIQQAYLKPSHVEIKDYFFGYSVDIYNDTIAIGAPRESSDATGINGDQTNTLSEYSGAVYVFKRSNHAWSQDAYIKPLVNNAQDLFGSDLSLFENTLAVGSDFEDSDGQGINSLANNDDALNSGAVWVFVDENSTWSQQVFIKSSNSHAGQRFGVAVDVFNDNLLVGAFADNSDSTGINGDSANSNASTSGAAYMFERTQGSWQQSHYIKASNTDSNDQFGTCVAMTKNQFVIGASGEYSAATVIDGDQSDNTQSRRGAAYYFQNIEGTWLQSNYVKSSTAIGRMLFGGINSCAISADHIAIGASGYNDSEGAVFVFSHVNQ